MMNFFNKAEADKHVACFKNMFGCFMERIPLLTIVLSMVVYVIVCQVLLFWLDVPLNKNGTEAPLLVGIFLKSILPLPIIMIGTMCFVTYKDWSWKGCANGITEFIKFIFVGFWVYIGNELKDIPNTFRNCFKCKGDD